MKYRHKWFRKINKLPQEYILHSFDYIKLRKKYRSYDDTFLEKIMKKADKVETFYQQCMEKLSFHYLSIQNKNDMDMKKKQNIKTLYKYVKIQKKTMKRICSKFDQKSNLKNTFLYWFHNIAFKKYSFLRKTHDYTALKLFSSKDMCIKDHVCPICFDDNKVKNCCITECGHIFCFDCHNQFESQNIYLCPICRNDLQNKPYSICEYKLKKE